MTVGDLPKLIATALYPPMGEEPTLSYLEKRVPNGQLAHLTDEDWRYLNEIFVGLPSLKEGIRKSQWPEYAFAFVHANQKPEWQLVPFWKDPVQDRAILRTDAVAQHRIALTAAIHEGRLTTRSHAMLPLAPSDGSLPMARILISDLQRYAVGMGLEVRIDAVQTLEPAASRWIIGDVARELGEQMASAHQEQWHREGANNGIRSDITAARFELGVMSDIEVLRRGGVIRPRTSDGSEVDPMSEIDRSWRLSRTDLELVLQYTRRDESSKQDYLSELTAHRATGRYTLRQAADQIAEVGGEDYALVLMKLKRDAQRGVLPMYRPGQNLRYQYDTEQRPTTPVRDFYDETYWSDLNNWLQQHEPGVVYRFPDPKKRPGPRANKKATPTVALGSPEWRSLNAKKAAEARHSRAGGSREKQQKIREIWATGNYSSRDICAEQECGALGLSYAAARRALRNTPDPDRA